MVTGVALQDRSSSRDTRFVIMSDHKQSGICIVDAFTDKSSGRNIITFGNDSAIV